MDTETPDQSSDSQPRPRKPSGRRGCAKKLGCGCLTFLIALSVGFVLLEWYLRRNVSHFLGAPAAGHYMYTTQTESFYTLTPGFRSEQTIDGRTTTIAINDRGLRGAEIGAKASGETRIIVLGDSLVFGHGVADDETIPARLEEHLAKLLPAKVTVANAGVAGHGTQDLPQSLAHHRALQPDLVIACSYVGNDFLDDSRRYVAVVEGFMLYGPLARLAHRSTRFQLTLKFRTLYAAENILSRYVPSMAFDRSELALSEDEVEAMELFPPEPQRFAGLFMDRRDDDKLVEKVFNRCRQHFALLRDSAGDTPVLHVILPTWWHLSPDVWRGELAKMQLDPEKHALGTTQRRLLELAAQMKLPMIDMTPKLREHPDRESLWLPTDRHLSPRGCDQVAAWLVPEVRRILGK